MCHLRPSSASHSSASTTSRPPPVEMKRRSLHSGSDCEEIQTAAKFSSLWTSVQQSVKRVSAHMEEGLEMLTTTTTLRTLRVKRRAVCSNLKNLSVIQGQTHTCTTTEIQYLNPGQTAPPTSLTSPHEPTVDCTSTGCGSRPRTPKSYSSAFAFEDDDWRKEAHGPVRRSSGSHSAKSE